MNEFKNSTFEKHARRYKSLHINRFFSLKCAADLVANQLFPNCKEITETFGAFDACQYLNEEFDWGNKDINVVCVGDGTRPRTAATFCYRSAWKSWSVDPALTNRHYNIKRLTCIPKKIEEIRLEFNEPTLICCVHSHAKLSDCIKSITAPKINIINIPCCFKSDLPFHPCLTYQDDQIWSEKNIVEIYK